MDYQVSDGAEMMQSPRLSTENMLSDGIIDYNDQNSPSPNEGEFMLKKRKESSLKGILRERKKGSAFVDR